LNTSELLLLLLLYTHELKHRFSRAAKGLGNSFPHGSWDLISQHFDRSMQPIPSRVFTSILVFSAARAFLPSSPPLSFSHAQMHSHFEPSCWRRSKTCGWPWQSKIPRVTSGMIVPHPPVCAFV
jgi:hypothetical protein